MHISSSKRKLLNILIYKQNLREATSIHWLKRARRTKRLSFSVDFSQSQRTNNLSFVTDAQTNCSFHTSTASSNLRPNKTHRPTLARKLPTLCLYKPAQWIKSSVEWWRRATLTKMTTRFGFATLASTSLSKKLLKFGLLQSPDSCAMTKESSSLYLLN